MLLEYASLLTITLLILQIGFIAGVLIGVIIGCATFAVSASRARTRPLHQAVITYVVTVMAERLSFARKMIDVLRR